MINVLQCPSLPCRHCSFTWQVWIWVLKYYIDSCCTLTGASRRNRVYTHHGTQLRCFVSYHRTKNSCMYVGGRLSTLSIETGAVAVEIAAETYKRLHPQNTIGATKFLSIRVRGCTHFWAAGTWSWCTFSVVWNVAFRTAMFRIDLYIHGFIIRHKIILLFCLNKDQSGGNEEK
jgi:hypothetical protein